MQALMIEEKGICRFREIADPQANPGEVVVAVRHVALCGSDLNTFRGLNPLVTLPRIPGHEIGGEIVAVGSGVPADTFIPSTAVNGASGARAFQFATRVEF